MILVDTSIWIELFNSKDFEINLKKLSQLAVCPPVIQEILQGIRHEKAYHSIKEGICALPCFGDPLNIDHFLLATDLYRLTRKRGRTIRSSVDCLIAAIAIKNSLPVWHRDRDFNLLAEISDLRIYEKH